MKKVCFLSTDDLSGYVFDDDLAIDPLRALDISAEYLSWRNNTRDWAEFDAVIIRTTWDYQRFPDEFLASLGTIEGAASLYNPLEIVRWNFDKKYLRELEGRGVAIVPTLFEREYSSENFAAWQNTLESEELIVKPRISATAEDTYRIRAFDPKLLSVFREKEFLVQPFIKEIVTTGEYSLFFFNGAYSHAILKTPKTKDFRVQEEHGGAITAIVPDEAMLASAKKALYAIPETLLYARVDLVRTDAGDQLMELELIEPALYLRMDASAPARFARAIAEIL